MAKLISFEGNIGTGKTTLLRKIKLELNSLVEVVEEPVSDWQNLKGKNVLESFYKEPRQYAVAFQALVGMTMARRNNVVTEKPIILSERSVESGIMCFIPLQEELGLLDTVERVVLEELLSYLSCVSRQPDLIIYVRCEPSLSMERIRNRDRKEEESVTISYIEKLHDYHEKWLMTKIQDGDPKVVLYDNSEDDANSFMVLLNKIKEVIS